MNNSKIEPKLLSVLREGYSMKLFTKDLVAGIVVGIVALPLAIAFAIASGVKPEQGLFTAIIAGFLISAFSGSRFQIGGPTGAFIVLIYGIVQKFGYDGLAVATMMAGAILIVMGIARFGKAIQYIPYPVTVGFTAGIAVIILTGQIRDLLGLSMTTVPPDFIDKLVAYAQNIGSINPWSCLIGAVTLLIVLGCKLYSKTFPGTLVALIATTVLVKLFNMPVETIGSRFGEISSSFPTPHIPWVGFEKMKELIVPAFSIAFLAGLESLLSAVVADGMTGRRHRPNTELIGQGIANFFSPFFMGIPATGAIARTATNIRSGGKTPIAGMIHATVLLLILFFFGKWAAYIPMATLAGILVLVAINMSEYKIFLHLLGRSPKSDIVVLFLTFAITIVIDLTIAIQIGVFLACLLFMRRMVAVSTVSSFRELSDEDEDTESIRNFEVPENVEVFEVNGPFFFGAADRFATALRQFRRQPEVIIMRMRHVPVMDATGLQALENVCMELKDRGIAVILSGVQPQPKEVMKKSGFLAEFGDKNLVANIRIALETAESHRKKSGSPEKAIKEKEQFCRV